MFISSQHSDDICTLHTKSDNIEIMMGNETDEIIKQLFESLLKKTQKGLEESMKGSEFTFDSVDLLYYKLHKLSLNRGESNIDSPKSIQSKKGTINPKNNDDKCFQYAMTSALNYIIIKSHPERISKIKLFINSIIGKKWIFHQIKRIGNKLN